MYFFHKVLMKTVGVAGMYLTRLPLCVNNCCIMPIELYWHTLLSHTCMLHTHERYDLIFFFYKTSSRKSIVSNIHYRVTATTNSSLCCNSWQPSQCFSLHLQVAGVTSTCYVLQENIHNAATSQSQLCQDLQSENLVTVLIVQQPLVEATATHLSYLVTIKNAAAYVALGSR